VAPLVNTLDGRLLLVFAGGLLAVGLLAIRSISQVEV
jgi:hypothetical protein